MDPRCSRGGAPAVAAAPAAEAEGTAAPDEMGGPVSQACVVTIPDTVHGMDKRGAKLLVAEWGIDMTRFNTVTRLSALRGVVSGNDERIGKQHLKAVLIDLAMRRHIIQPRTFQL